WLDGVFGGETIRKLISPVIPNLFRDPTDRWSVIHSAYGHNEVPKQVRHDGLGGYRTHIKKIIFFAFTFLLLAFTSKAQIKPFNPDTIRTIVIDTPIVNITAHRLNANDFIRAVLADTGFCQAFRNMKKYAFIAENYIYTYDKKSRINGKIYRKLKHSFSPSGKPLIEYLAKRDS